MLHPNDLITGRKYVAQRELPDLSEVASMIQPNTRLVFLGEDTNLTYACKFKIAAGHQKGRIVFIARGDLDLAPWKNTVPRAIAIGLALCLLFLVLGIPVREHIHASTAIMALATTAGIIAGITCARNTRIQT